MAHKSERKRNHRRNFEYLSPEGLESIGSIDRQATIYNLVILIRYQH